MAHVPQGVFKLTVRMQRDSPNIPWGFRMQGKSLLLKLEDFAASQYLTSSSNPCRKNRLRGGFRC